MTIKHGPEFDFFNRQAKALIDSHQKTQSKHPQETAAAVQEALAYFKTHHQLPSALFQSSLFKGNFAEFQRKNSAAGSAMVPQPLFAAFAGCEICERRSGRCSGAADPAFTKKRQDSLVVVSVVRDSKMQFGRRSFQFGSVANVCGPNSML